ncbi:serine protease inhibitor dipetalogastin-like [Mizuhopecten yessoensis]|uniref:serine protease inhibitor dipetalogastin-like n=1 Tax=Mizuhopecten yessoensis TaxID=6573 RepID=UPI000B45AD97|nr:serine protease inhibitor dipetalogastin-like [Mizuhopecten yessoensis]
MMPRTLFALLVVIVVVNGKDPCICTAEYDPWCGEEGGTYSNLCWLKCAGDEIEGHDTCENIEECLKAYPEPPSENEVCAEYGITFDSIEEMECHNLSFVHDGECDGEASTTDQ